MRRCSAGGGMVIEHIGADSDATQASKDREKREVLFGVQDRRLGRLLETVVDEVKLYANAQIGHIEKLAQIGLALSGEKNVDRLLEMIVDEARELTFADAGTLYIVDDAGRHLDFVILQNDTMNTRMGGTSGVEITLPSVPMYKEDGSPNHQNVSSYAALTNEIVNIEDVYVAEGFDFTGPRKYDQATGYRSKSMLVIPMQNHENDIIGVLQLLNAKDEETQEVAPFAKEYVDLVASLASQAAVALTNARLIRDLKELLYSFIRSIASAIDAKSPYTKGHIDRVVELTMLIADAVNAAGEGPYGASDLSEDELEELKLAAWMHDVGKITTPEFVVDKSTKLETIFDRVELIKSRFAYIEKSIEADHYRNMARLAQAQTSQSEIRRIEDAMHKALEELREERDFVLSCNNPGEFMDDDKIERLRKIAKKTYTRGGERRPYLTENEVENLSIRKGTLTEAERKKIEDHARMTLEMLGELPFPKRLARVPEYAAGHHEKLDGSGYPQGLTKDKLPLQSRILAVADVFEALTARDRPYKKPMKLSMAVKILGFMRKDGHIDGDILDLFLASGAYKAYAEKHLNPDQVDEVDV
jgi:HD-GYP domain-containing protein (c-di-GMP phosphodiesterase class II)